MDTQTLDITREPNTCIKSGDTLPSLINAVADLGLIKQTFTHYLALGEHLTDEYCSLVFFSAPPLNVPSYPLLDDSVNDTNALTGMMVGGFLHYQMSDPAVPMYANTPGAKLGGWDLMAFSDNEDVVLRADRILLGTTSKAN